MKRKPILRGMFLGLVAVIIFSTGAFGAGFGSYWVSDKGIALGPMFTGMADDPSAAYYNPAGVTQLNGNQVMAGISYLNPSNTIEAGGTDTKMAASYYFPPFVYLTNQLSDKFWFSFGAYSPFGLGVDYGANSPVRYNVFKGKVTSVNLNPNIAWKITDKLSVAAGLDVMWFKVNVQQAIPTPAGDVDTDLNADSWALGYNLAIHYKPIDWMSLGVSYRSGMNQDVEGDLKFTKPAAVGTLFNNTDINSRFKIPQELSFGLAVKPGKNVTVGAGATWTGWSSFKNLTVEYETPVNVGVTSVDGNTVQKDWKDAWRIGAGIEWNVTDTLDFRLGLLRDFSPVPDSTMDYLVPDSNRWEFSTGIGFHKDNMNVGLSYMLILFDERDIQARSSEGVLDGKVKDGRCHVVALSFTYKF